jgi:hypothetical protein
LLAGWLAVVVVAAATGFFFSAIASRPFLALYPRLRRFSSYISFSKLLL